MSADPVRIQVGIRLLKDAPVTHEFLRLVIMQWANTGKLPKGIKIVYVRWINPRRAAASLAVWKDSRDSDQSLEGARTTLRGLLRAGHFTFSVGFNRFPPKVKIKIIKRKAAKKRSRRAVKAYKKADKKPKKRKLRDVRKNKGVRK